jgi:RNA polymerase sigma-70 factor (ECF subfamily)
LRPDFLDAYQEHVWHVYGYLAFRLRSQADAEDLTQLTFERAFKAWDSYDERKGTLRTWLITIARNTLIDHRRRGDSRPQAAAIRGELAETDAGVEEGPEQSLGIDPALAAALERLSRRERSVVALRFGADLPTREIAEVLDLSVAHVQQIMSRALRRLRTLLDADLATSQREAQSARSRR